MKGQFFIFSALIIVGVSLLFGCEKEYLPARNQSFLATLDKSALESEALKGIIVSNQSGLIFFEKILTESDKAEGLELDFKKNEEEIVQVSFVTGSVDFDGEDSFKIQTYYDVRSGAVLKKEIPNPQYKTVEIRISGLTPGVLPIFSLNSGYGIQSSSFGAFEGDEFVVKNSRFLKNQPIFFVIRYPTDPMNRYFYYTGNERDHTLDYQFLPYLTNRFSIKFERCNVPSIKAWAYSSAGELPMFNGMIGRFFADIYLLNEILLVDSFKIELQNSWMEYNAFVKEFPSFFISDCSYAPSFVSFVESPEKIIDAFTVEPDYFIVKRRYDLNSFDSNNGYHEVKGIYKKNFEYVFPKISNQMLTAVPALINLESSNWEGRTAYYFDTPRFTELMKNPLLIENRDWRFLSGTQVCND